MLGKRDILYQMCSHALKNNQHLPQPAPFSLGPYYAPHVSAPAPSQAKQEGAAWVQSPGEGPGRTRGWYLGHRKSPRLEVRGPRFEVQGARLSGLKWGRSRRQTQGRPLTSWGSEHQAPSPWPARPLTCHSDPLSPVPCCVWVQPSTTRTPIPVDFPKRVSVVT